MFFKHFILQLKNSATFPARREQSVTWSLGSVCLGVEGKA